MKFSFTKNPRNVFFIKNPNLTKHILAGGRGGGGVGVRVSDFFFQNKPSLNKIVYFSFFRG